MHVEAEDPTFSDLDEEGIPDDQFDACTSGTGDGDLQRGPVLLGHNESARPYRGNSRHPANAAA